MIHTHPSGIARLDDIKSRQHNRNTVSYETYQNERAEHVPSAYDILKEAIWNPEWKGYTYLHMKKLYPTVEISGTSMLDGRSSGR